MNNLTYKEALRLFRYEPESGNLYWKVTTTSAAFGNGRAASAGDIAGWVKNGKYQSYRSVRVRGKTYRVHRIIWLMLYGKWPKHEIDHIDGDGLNNRPSNLRDVTHQVNMANSKRTKNSESGVCGVRYHKQREKWNARIQIQGKEISLGLYDTKQEAITARERFDQRGYRKRQNS